MIPSLSKQRFAVDPGPCGCSFRLLEMPLVGRERVIAPELWIASAKGAQLAGAGQLLAWLDEGVAVRDGDALTVPHATIAALDDGVARSIGLPPAVPWVLDLGHDGTLDRPDFRFRLTWRNTRGLPQPGLVRIGSILRSGTATYRLPQTLFELVEAVEAFNAAAPGDLDQRFRIWGRMRAQLPDESQQSIELDGYLRSTRIAHAARFSLDLQSGADGFSFKPVLFGPGRPRPAARDEDDETGSDGLEDSPGILPPAQHRGFSERRFPASAECRARYALGAGWYVVIDEPVRQALTVVRRAQGADRETRRQFARNPRAFLRQALGESLDEAAIDRLFVETREYSERVQDVALWTPIVIPWLKKTTQAWLPESVGEASDRPAPDSEGGIVVDGRKVPLPIDRLPEIAAALEQANRAGIPTVQVDGQDIPATAETLAAVHSLMKQVAPPDADGAAEQEQQVKEPQRQPVVLAISDNLAEMEYGRALKPRLLDAPDGPPALLRTVPKPHQEDGIRWLQQQWRVGMPGILLADDMGLGKTLQALSFLAWLRDAMVEGRWQRRPFLVVAPTGLLKTWQAEHDRHLQAPGLGRCLEAHGPGLKRVRVAAGTEIATGRAALDVTALADADWVVTTYETMRDYQHSFAAVPFAVIVFDEVQRTKTPGVLMTHAAKALNGDFIVAMTGTPIENRLADLWCIVDTAFPGRLGDLKTFSQIYEKDENPDELRKLKVMLTEGHAGAPPLMLRRMKIDHLPGLPEKHEHVLAEPMPPEQARAYERAVANAKGRTKKGHMLEALQQLRSISLHPLRPADATDQRYIEQSARLRVTFQILDRLHQIGQKALIVLESLALQSYLAALVQRRYRLSALPMCINGDVAGPERQQRVNTFQAATRGFDVIILSPRAGGVGLTLTAANHVIHLSRWWNPAVEDQCTDRAYRIGQERDVHVYFVQAIHPVFGEQSFDHRLHELLQRKRALSREMLMPPVDPENDARRLFAQTVGASAAAGAAADAGAVDAQPAASSPDAPDLAALIAQGESERLEFKATFQWDVRQSRVATELRHQSIKTIAAFLNTSGGTLLIGIEDDGTVRGLADDLRSVGNSQDKLGQTLAASINEAIGPVYAPFYSSSFETVDDKLVCRIQVQRAAKPVFVKGPKGKEFFIRQGNRTLSLDTEDAVQYIALHRSS